MLTKTTELAIRALTWLAMQERTEYHPPREIAMRMGCSPSYLAKVMGGLVKAGILRSHRGPSGGTALALAPEEIDLLRVVECC